MQLQSHLILDDKDRAISSSTGFYTTWQYNSAQGSQITYVSKFWSFDPLGKFILSVQIALFSELWLLKPKCETEP